MRWRSMVLIGFSCLIVGAAGESSLAADNNYKGWYGNLDIALTQPNSLDQHFANFIDFSGTQTEDHRLVIENDDALTLRFDVGYSWGGKGALQLSYWSFDNDDGQSDSLDGSVYPTIFGYGSDGGMYAYDATGVSYDVESSVKATTWDVDYIRPMSAGEKFSVRWLAGLRVASYEEDQAVEISDAAATYDCSTASCLQGKHFESDAMGFRVGVTAVFEFTEMFALEGGAAFSFLQADLEGDSFQTFVGTSTETNEATDDNIRGQINDYSLRAVWDFGPIDWYIGYQMSDWSGLVTDPVPGNEGGHFAAGPISSRGRDSISFNSWDTGIRWRFGGD